MTNKKNHPHKESHLFSRFLILGLALLILALILRLIF